MAVPVRKNNGNVKMADLIVESKPKEKKKRKVKPKQRKGIGRPHQHLEEGNRKSDKRSVYGLRGTYAERFGQMQITKGTKNGMKLVSWDAIPECRESCPIAEKCPYTGKKKCTVMKSYVGSAASIIQNNYDLDEADMLRVGLHLLPLYRNLCRLQIEEFALEGITRVNKAGSTVLHPIYDSIKAHVSAIESLWKALGLLNNAKKKRKTDIEKYHHDRYVPTEVPTVGDIVNGNPDYYDTLSE